MGAGAVNSNGILKPRSSAISLQGLNTCKPTEKLRNGSMLTVDSDTSLRLSMNLQSGKKQIAL